MFARSLQSNITYFRCDRGRSASAEAAAVRERFDRQHVRFDKSTDEYQEWKRSRDGELSKAIRSEE